MIKTNENQLQDTSVQSCKISINAPNKSPISVVQEYASKKKIKAEFKLVLSGISESKICFKYHLSLDCNETIGEGTSKIVAKQNAALNMIKIIIDKDFEFFNAEFKDFNYDQPQNEENVNYEIDLMKFCRDKLLGSVELKFVGEEGYPPNKLFTFSCSVAGLIEIVKDRTKKKAKKLAAEQMMKKLNSISAEELDKLKMKKQEISEEMLDNIQRARNLKKEESNILKKNIPPPSLQPDTYHLNLQNSGKLLNSATFKEVFDQYKKNGNQIKLKDPLETLSKINKECNLKIIHQKLPTADNNMHMFIYMTTNEEIYPVIASTGRDISEDLAHNQAIVELLNSLCILCT